MQAETLIRMGTQIARNNAALPPDRAVERVAAHLRSFWTPAMIAELQDAAAADPGALDPLLAGALRELAQGA